MAKSAVINFQILGDSKSAEQALKNTTAAAEKTGTTVKAAGESAGTMKDHLLSLVPGGQQAAGALTKLGTAGSDAGSIFKGALTAGPAAAGAAIAGMAVQGVQKFADLTLAVQRYKNVTGASTEEASKMIGVAKELGVDTDTLSGAMFKLGANVQAQPQKFKDLGIEIAHNKDGTVNLVGTLENASKAYQATTDATQKDAIAKALGGKAGAALIPILKAGSDALDQYANSATKVTDADLKTGAEFRQSMRDLKQSVDTLEIDMAKGLVPTLSATAEGLNSVVRAADAVTKPLGGISGVMDKIKFVNPAALIGDTVDKFEQLFGSTKKAKASTEEMTAAQSKGVEVTKDMSEAELNAATSAKDEADAEKEVADAAHAAGAELEKRWEATNKLLDAQAGAIDSDLAFRKAEQGLADANQTVTDKQTALNDAIKQHGANSAEAKAATDDLAKAQQDAVGAVISDAEAFVKLKDDQAAANGETLTAQQNHDLLRQRLQDVANALGPNSPLRSQLLGYINDLKAVPSQIVTDVETVYHVQGTPGPSGGPAGGVRVRASGGEVGAGDYLVADTPGDPHGTGELLHLEPGSRGHVTNAAATKRLMQGAPGGARAVHMTVTANHYWNVGVLDKTVVPLIDARIEQATNQIVRALATATA